MKLWVIIILGILSYSSVLNEYPAVQSCLTVAFWVITTFWIILVSSVVVLGIIKIAIDK